MTDQHPFDRYKAACDLLAARKGEINSIIGIATRFASTLEQYPHAAVIDDGGEAAEAVAKGHPAFALRLADWPTAEQIAKSVRDFQDAKKQAVAAWESLQKDEQAALQRRH